MTTTAEASFLAWAAKGSWDASTLGGRRERNVDDGTDVGRGRE